MLREIVSGKHAAVRVGRASSNPNSAAEQLGGLGSHLPVSEPVSQTPVLLKVGALRSPTSKSMVLLF